MKKTLTVLILFTQLIFATENEIIKEKKEYKFYYFKPEKEGSAAFYNPINFILQGGVPGGKDMSKVDFIEGTQEVFGKIINPINSINKYGWKKFFYYEFIPHTGKGDNFVPNYIWHLFGGGFRTKLMEEYYTYYEYKYPKIWAWSTMYVLHFLNEISQVSYFNKTSSAQELGDKSNDTVDAIADLMFFDWIGGVIFSFDCVNDFFTKYGHLTEWSSQSLIDFQSHRLMNNGQLYWLRFELFNPISLSFLSGSPISALGLTYSHNNIHQFSIGYGYDVGVVQKNEIGDLIPSKIMPIFGFYYSKNDNPFLTIVFRKGLDEDIDKEPWFANKLTSRVTLNLYPGVLKINNTTFGLYMSYQKEAFFIGVTSGNWPIGFTISTPQDEVYLNAY